MHKNTCWLQLISFYQYLNSAWFGGCQFQLLPFKTGTIYIMVHECERFKSRSLLCKSASLYDHDKFFFWLNDELNLFNARTDKTSFTVSRFEGKRNWSSVGIKILYSSKKRRFYNYFFTKCFYRSYVLTKNNLNWFFLCAGFIFAEMKRFASGEIAFICMYLIGNVLLTI